MLWIKAFHIIAVITWFAALFYLPRLFVYHADAHDSISNERFKVMERKLYRGIMTPSLIVVVALGIWLSTYFEGIVWQQPWFHIKVTLVALIIIYHFYCGHIVKQFKHDQNTRSHKWYRVFNEAPVLALVAIIILVEVQPSF